MAFPETQVYGRLDYRGRSRFEIVSEVTVGFGFGDFFSIYGTLLVSMVVTTVIFFSMSLLCRLGWILV